jgi:hypothetical protein
VTTPRLLVVVETMSLVSDSNEFSLGLLVDVEALYICHVTSGSVPHSTDSLDPKA